MQTLEDIKSSIPEFAKDIKLNFSSIKFSNLDDLIDDDDPDASFAKNIFPEKIRLRLKYIYECNFWLDIKLILLTLRRLIGIK